MNTLPHRILFPKRPDPANALRLDMSALPMMGSMMQNGMKISRSQISSLNYKMTSEMEELQSTVDRMCGFKINIASGDQLSNLLFNDLKLKQAGKERWTKSRARMAVDSDVLKGMISQHQVIRPILDWKEREKLRSTYTFSLLKQADENDRIHPTLIHTGPETGRLACKDPNLQNIPTRSKLGQEVRRAFIPEPGNVLGTCDASQIEMRVHAHDSQCVNLLNIFWNWWDVYWSTAELMYEREFSQEDRKHGVEKISGLSFKEYYRFNAKTTALAVSYEISPEGLVDQFLVSNALAFLTDGDFIYGSDGKLVWDYNRHYTGAVKKCSQAIIDFYRSYPELLERRKEHHRRARKFGLVWDDFGRIRWIPQVYSTHRWIVSEGLRAAGNHPIQGSAAGIVKLWMACIWDRIESYWGKHGVRPLIAIHDEIAVEGPKSVLEDYLPECAKILRNLLPYSMINAPLESNFAIGNNWAELEK